MWWKINQVKKSDFKCLMFHFLYPPFLLKPPLSPIYLFVTLYYTILHMLAIHPLL